MLDVVAEPCASVRRDSDSVPPVTLKICDNVPPEITTECPPPSRLTVRPAGTTSGWLTTMVPSQPNTYEPPTFTSLRSVLASQVAIVAAFAEETPVSMPAANATADSATAADHVRRANHCCEMAAHCGVRMPRLCVPNSDRSAIPKSPG